jgi:hypothetical protein
MATWVEKLIGMFLAITAVLWAAYHVTSVHEAHAAFLRLGPMQLLMAGLMMWLHGKYRAVHFARLRREYIFGHPRSQDHE